MSGSAPATGAYRPRLQRRLMSAFAVYTLLVGTLLGLLAMALAYAVEDEFFASLLRAETHRQQQHHVAQGAWATPVLPFVRVYPRGESLPADLAAHRAAHTRHEEVAGAEGRHYHLRRLHADGTLLVAEVSGQLVVRPLRHTLLLWLVVAGGLFTVLALLLAWQLSRRISAPLALLAQRVAEGSPAALPEGLAHGLERDEVGELAHHLETLYERTRAFIAREQAFTADASHELRTPLAVLGMSCERLRATAPAALQPLLQSTQAAVWQLQQTVELLLALAREAPAGLAAPPPVPAPERRLLPELEHLLLAHAPLLDQLGVQVVVDVPAGLTRPWPPGLAQVLVGNLLANAIAHAQAPRVRITADTRCLTVCNPSPPPPGGLLGEGVAGRVRGVKGPDSSGQGFGLSIVRRLAERHGLRLGLSHDGGQTCVTLCFASASHAAL